MQNPFSFSTPASQNTNPAGQTTSTPFNFGASSNPNAAATSTPATNLFGAASQATGQQPAAKSLFSFGNTPNPTQPTASTSTGFGGFNFASGTQTQAQPAQPAQLAQPAQPAASAAPSLNSTFSFGSALKPTVSSTNLAGSASTTSGFGFLSGSTNPPAVAQPAASTKPFSFGFGTSTSSTTATATPQPAATTTPAPSFSFGNTAATAPPSSTSTPALSSLGSTGSSTLQPSASSTGFGFLKSTQPTLPTSTSSTTGSGFSFGGGATTTTTTDTKPTVTLGGGSLTTSASGTGLSLFGQPKQQAATTTTPTPSATSTPAPTNLFGASAALSSSGPATGGFSFGATSSLNNLTASASTQDLGKLVNSSTTPGLNLSTPATAAPAAAATTQPTQPKLEIKPVLNLGSTTPATTGLTLGGIQATPTATAPTTTTTTTTDAKPSLFSSLGTTTTTTTTTAASAATTTAGGATATTGAATATPVKPAAAAATTAPTTTTTAAGTTNLPNLVSFSVPSFSSASADAAKSSDAKPVGLGGLSSVTNSSTSGAGTSSGGMGGSSAGMQSFRAQSIKDHPLPQTMMDFVDNFKKSQEEMRKTKELNSTFTSKSLYQNIQDLGSVKQKLTQSRTEFQRNVNETIKLKEQIAYELRNVDICEHLKDMPLGLQYDNDIWSEYFLSRVQHFQNKMHLIKNQFEQLEGYFRAHEANNLSDYDKIIETMKITYRNMLNEAANLKIIHEKVEELKKNYLLYRKSTIGDATNIFEEENDENQTIATSVSFNMSTNRI